MMHDDGNKNHISEFFTFGVLQRSKKSPRDREKVNMYVVKNILEGRISSMGIIGREVRYES